MIYKNNVFVVIPAYNEEKHLPDVLRHVLKYSKNIIVVNDGSTDSTPTIASKFPITLISLPLNMGKGYALRVGCEHAFKLGGDGVVTIDSDGQHRADHIPKFLRALNNYPVVIGVRKGFHKIPLIRKLGNRMATLLIFLLYRIYVDDLLCGFRAFNKSAFEKIKWSSDKYGVETEMIARLGLTKLKFKQIEVENIYLDQYKGVTLLDALEVFLSIPKFTFNQK